MPYQSIPLPFRSLRARYAYPEIPDADHWAVVFPCIRGYGKSILHRANEEAFLDIAPQARILRDDKMGLVYCLPNDTEEETLEAVRDMVASLCEYPCADDEILSRLEWEDYLDQWASGYATRDYIRRLPVSERAQDLLRDWCPPETLRGLYEEGCDWKGAPYYENEGGESVWIPTERGTDPDRATLAKLVWEARKALKNS